MKRLTLLSILILTALTSSAQYTHQDTLRGSNGRGRDWWDVMKYRLTITIDTTTKSVSGRNAISFRLLGSQKESLQIDLQQGLTVDEVGYGDLKLPFSREGNVYWIKTEGLSWEANSIKEITIYYHGKPREAVNPPWDGGFIWTKDNNGKPWIAVACQGLGASSWWPCKDYQGDEPDSGMTTIYNIRMKTPTVVGNGLSHEYQDTILQEDPITGNVVNLIASAAGWSVRNPINTYNTTFYIGDYAHYRDTLRGEKGVLDLDFYPLAYNEAKSRKHWAVTKQMLHCFEYWMGPYPFYQDGYKLVEAPYLGMEHQSAIAYGNAYQMGYRGRDISGTGVGLAFDYIIIHESAHEWFGNSITAQDRADNWLHEGFATYAECLFVEWIKGKDAAFKYTTHQRHNQNYDDAVIEQYGVNAQGSGNQYYRGAAIIHMIRLMLNDDQKFRQLLRGLNKDFYHKIVTSRQVEDYISHFMGRDLKPFFRQYLHQVALPSVLAKQQGKNVTLTLKGYEDALTLPIYYEGRLVCELSKNPVTIPVKDLKALLNYLIIYIPADSGTLPLVED